jgi:hypothetical protein
MKFVILLFLGSGSFYGCMPASNKVLHLDGSFEGRAMGLHTCDTDLCNGASVVASGTMSTFCDGGIFVAPVFLVFVFFNL